MHHNAHRIICEHAITSKLKYIHLCEILPFSYFVANLMFPHMLLHIPQDINLMLQLTIKACGCKCKATAGLVP